MAVLGRQVAELNAALQRPPTTRTLVLVAYAVVTIGGVFAVARGTAEIHRAPSLTAPPGKRLSAKFS